MLCIWDKITQALTHMHQHTHKHICVQRKTERNIQRGNVGIFSTSELHRWRTGSVLWCSQSTLKTDKRGNYMVVSLLFKPGRKTFILCVTSGGGGQTHKHHSAVVKHLFEQSLIHRVAQEHYHEAEELGSGTGQTQSAFVNEDLRF